jgi:hypothetical protein
MSELTLSKKDKHAVDLDIIIIQVMLSVKLSPKVIKTSGFHCNYQFVFWQVEAKAIIDQSNTCSLCKYVAKNRSRLRYHLAVQHGALRDLVPSEVYNSLGLVSWNLLAELLAWKLKRNQD